VATSASDSLIHAARGQLDRGQRRVPRPRCSRTSWSSAPRR